MTDVFEPYLARNKFGTTAAQVRGFADTTKPANTSLSTILDELDTSRAQVRSTIDGQPAAPTEENVNSLDTKTRKTHRRGITFAAAMEYLASKVETHDSDINGLAASHPDADAEKAGELARPINNRLDTAGEDVAALLDGDPDAELSVKDLILAGYIPLGAADYWPNINANLTDAEKRRARANAIRTMTPEEQARYILDNPDLDFPVADIAPEAQRTIAAAVTDDVENPGQIDEDTVNLLSLLKEEAPFTKALYDPEGGVSPEEMADAIQYLSDAAYATNSNEARYSRNDDSIDPALYDGFMNAAGVALATATRNTPLATTDHGTRYHPMTDEWANAITNAEKPADGAALTLLMREGGEQPEGRFDPTFLGDVADRVYQFEQKHGPDIWNEFGSTWGDPHEGLVIDPDKAQSEHHDRPRGGDYTTWSGPGQDGLANILGAMGNTPEAAQGFFSDDNGSGTDTERLEYLLTERDWDFDEHKGTGSGVLSHYYGSDNGDGLGEALEAATVGHLSPGQQGSDGYDEGLAADLTSDAFNIIADNSTPAGEDGLLPSGIKDNLGNIGAGYADDLYYELQNKPDGASAGDAGDNRIGPTLNLDEGALEKVLGELGRDPDHKTGTEILTTALLQEGNRQVDNTINDVDNPFTDGAERVNGVTKENAAVLREMLDHSVALQSGDEDADQQRREILSKALDIASSLPVVEQVADVKDSVNSSIELAQSLSLSELSERVGEAPPSSADAYNTRSKVDVLDQLASGLQRQLEHHGYNVNTSEAGSEVFPDWYRDMESVLDTTLGKDD